MNRAKLIAIAEGPDRKSEVPSLEIGDNVTVHVRIKEGNKERLQPFSGVVIARQGAGVTETFTVRRIVENEGVERVFPIHSPSVAKVEVTRHGMVNRAKLYFLRDRVGKATRLRERHAKKAEAPQAPQQQSLLPCCATGRTPCETMPQQHKDITGRRGERIARRFLRWRRGYRIIESNWRSSRLGELDIVALDGQVLVFVEVKSCEEDALTVPEDAITPDKRQRLRQLARTFCGHYGLDHLPCRFDVLAVTLRPWPRPAKVTHYKDAF